MSDRRASHESHAQAKALGLAARPYLDAHPESFGGRWIDWDGGEATYVVAFTGDLAAHRTAIDPGVRVMPADYPAAELGKVAADLGDFVRQMAGVEPVSWGVHDPVNRVVLDAIATDPDALRAAIRERFGDRVAVEITATEEWSVGVVDFQTWSATGRQLTVHRLGGAGERDHRLEIEEDASAIRIRIVAELYNGIVAGVGCGYRFTGDLAAPVGGRGVIDLSSGATRDERSAHDR